MLTSSLIKSKLEEIEKRALKNLFFMTKKSSHFQSKRDGGNFIIESVYLATNNESIWEKKVLNRSNKDVDPLIWS